MSKNLWQKVRKNHLFLVILCCLAPLALIIGFLFLLKGNKGYLVWLILLLCPVLHFWMMRKHPTIEKEKLYQCPECGFWYKEKEWAEKCETWCKEHKTCNLEIIKHAIKK